MVEPTAIERETLPDSPDPVGDLTAAIAAERPRLVRLCARITGDWDAAEDLAQETVIEAWRSLAKLHDARGLAVWTNAIARHVCQRWLRRRAHDLRFLYDRDLETADNDEIDDIDDPLVGLERAELAELLHRALALLPLETRKLLTETYLHERSHDAIAADSGMSAGTLRVKLHRGRHALREVLQGALRADALASDIVLPETSNWQETRTWCPFCGRHHLEVAIDRTTGAYSYRCAGNCQPGTMLVNGAQDLQLVNELTNPKAILTRHCLAAQTAYRAMITAGEEMCPTCGRTVPVKQWLPDGAGNNRPPSPLFALGIYVACPTCGPMGTASPWHLTLDTPSALRFWRCHPRMRALPTREIERDGRLALVTGFESVQTSARIEIISARETYRTLAVFGDTTKLSEPEEAGDS